MHARSLRTFKHTCNRLFLSPRSGTYLYYHHLSSCQHFSLGTGWVEISWIIEDLLLYKLHMAAIFGVRQLWHVFLCCLEKGILWLWLLGFLYRTYVNSNCKYFSELSSPSQRSFLFFSRDTGLKVWIYHLALFTIVQENKREGRKQLICSSVVILLLHRSMTSLVPACLHTVPILKLPFSFVPQW